jgi:hypothetical protein
MRVRAEHQPRTRTRANGDDSNEREVSVPPLFLSIFCLLFLSTVTTRTSHLLPVIPTHPSGYNHLPGSQRPPPPFTTSSLPPPPSRKTINNLNPPHSPS